MTDLEQRLAAKSFAEFWAGKGYEKGQSQPFWTALLGNVLGTEHPEQLISFEDQVKLDHTSFIDGTIAATHVLIEQKGIDKDLRKPIKQSDGTLLNPFQQAKRYAAELPYSMRPRWIVTCNFKEFLIYDMELPSGEPESILLENLEKEYYRLQFLVDTGDSNIKKEMEISIQAGNLVGVLYEELLRQYHDPSNAESLKSLNMLCVRLVFCLYAEDAGIFGERGKFHNYLQQFPAKDARRGLIDLFHTLDIKPEDRDTYMDASLAAFPYVNGGLFSDENIEIPQFTQEILDLLLHSASEDFDWSEISPTIFGAVFESTLNPETRRSGGMHYTSIENIHKVIDPLFLDGLREELVEIKTIPVDKTRKAKLVAYQEKLSALKFLDPACGSGNFLTETYLSLRRLENEVLSTLSHGQIAFGDANINPIEVSIGQFYGIEINDFAVTVAKTAMWIAESQMLKETEDVVHMNLDFLPLKSYANIHEGNALQVDWETVVPKHELNYIMGNPPFVGLSLRTAEQQEDMKNVFSDNDRAGRLDYVAAWYKKACEYSESTAIECAFVSTNSITQGEQVPILWDDLIMQHGIIINYAYRTFTWNNESKGKAAVFCVIIGFSHIPRKTKQIFTYNNIGKTKIAQDVDYINGYLVNAPNVFIQLRGNQQAGFPRLVQGSKPWDGGNLLLTEDESKDLLKEEPYARKYIRKFVGSREFINNINRYCIWLEGANPTEYRSMPKIMERLRNVAEIRKHTKTVAVQKQAETPMLFSQIRQPKSNYILIPETSSGTRKYIPLGFVSADVIAGNSTLVAENATLLHFGILTSNVHMAWVNTVCGRLKGDYRYSPSVYNNFPWPDPTDAQRAKIEATAQEVLDARVLYPDSSLADLYDEITMPPELRRAHQANDRAVMQAYGFPIKDFSESDCVAALMKLYQEKIAALNEKP